MMTQHLQHHQYHQLPTEEALLIQNVHREIMWRLQLKIKVMVADTL